MAKQDLRLAKAGDMLYREFWGMGIPIFPLYRFNVDGDCECGQDDCEIAGKHPRPSSWQHTPIWDEDQIETAEEFGYYDTGYGVLCRGLLVVDVDARNGGVASYKKLVAAIPNVDDAGLSVSTGSGGGSQHLYFRAPAGVSFVSHHPDYPGIDFKSSGYVVGPGSAHKSGGVYVADGYPEDIGEAPQELIDLLRQPERHRTEYDGHAIDIGLSELSDVMSYIPNNDLPYEDWIGIGMAVHHTTGGTGFDIWRQWSATSTKHDPKMMERKWYSFGKSANPVTAGTLIHRASQNGWTMPVTFSPDGKLLEEEQHVAGDGLPFDIAGIDLTEPPGFVGDVAHWIDSQGFRPRRRLAVAAALVSVGNIGGLRYIDDTTGVSANIFAFCIAGSGSGKDAVLGAAMQLHQAAGISGAVHGGIKSEQEMTRNLLEHQASFYIVDEVASLFSKIKNASKSGNAAYLEGIPQKMMEAYSKTRKAMGTSGDIKRELRKSLLADLSQLQKRELPQDVLDQKEAALKLRLDRVDRGIESPFVSFMGVTVPNKFLELFDYDMATNGFIGRSLVFNERETVPPVRKRHKPPQMPDTIANYVRAIWTGGEYDMMAEDRVECLEQPVEIETEDKGKAMLDQASDWMEMKASEARDSHGLEALYMRGYEMVAKVSLILAIPERLRTAEHVRWAFALVKRDIEDKINIVLSNDTDKDYAEDAITAKFLSVIGDDPDGLPEGTVMQRMKRAKWGEKDVAKLVTAMQQAGRIKIVTGTHPTNKKSFRRFCRC